MARVLHLVRRFAALFLRIGVVAGATACGGEPGGETGSTAVPVETVVVARADFAETLDALATVGALPGGTASVSAPGPTRVLAVRVAEGEQVARGQPLVELDQAVWSAERAGAAAALEAAEGARARAARLVEEGILPRKDLETATAELARARADAALAERLVSLGVLRAPIDGVVTRVGAPVGAEVDAGTPLVDLIDPAALEAVLHLSPAAAARVGIGNPITLFRDAPEGRVVVADGIVTRLSLTLDAAGARTAGARLTVPHANVAVGEVLSARVVVALHAGVVSVPTDALVPDEAGGFLIYVVGPGGVAHARDAVLGPRSDERAVVASGLEEGDVVVVEGAFQLLDGADVVAR